VDERKKVGWIGIKAAERDQLKSWESRSKMGRGVRRSSMSTSPQAEKIADVRFIPVAPTFVTKALGQVVQRDCERTRIMPGMRSIIATPSLQLIAVTCNGDLRSAVNSLQLLSTQSKKRKAPTSETTDSQAGVPWTKRLKAKGKGSRGGKGAKLQVDDELRAA
jgi:cell cycle checkpoint protein